MPCITTQQFNNFRISSFLPRWSLSADNSGELRSFSCRRQACLFPTGETATERKIEKS